MAVLLDSGILYAYFDRRDHWHERAAELIRGEQGQLIVPAPVVPEVDYLLDQRVGGTAQLDFYRSLAEGEYLLVDLPLEQYGRILELNLQFSDLRIGFVDAAIIAIGEALGLKRIATTDRRHFEPLASALALELLP